MKFLPISVFQFQFQLYAIARSHFLVGAGRGIGLYNLSNQ